MVCFVNSVMTHGSFGKVFIHINSLIPIGSPKCNAHGLWMWLINSTSRMQVAVNKVSLLPCQWFYNWPLRSQNGSIFHGFQLGLSTFTKEISEENLWLSPPLNHLNHIPEGENAWKTGHIAYRVPECP